MGSNKAALEFQAHVDKLVNSIEDGTFQKSKEQDEFERASFRSLVSMWLRYELPGEVHPHEGPFVGVKLTFEQAAELAELLRDHFRRA